MLTFTLLMAAMSGFFLARGLASRQEARHVPNPDARLARLQRLAAENKDLVAAVGTVVVPVTVALVALTGVVLMVLFRTN